MARVAQVDAIAGSLDAPIRRALKLIFEYVLANLRIGRAEDKKRSENLQLYFYHVTTPATANQEFTIAHGLAATPYLLFPVLPLDAAGKKLVDLEVSKVADNKRIYLKSPTTNAKIVVAVEV